MKKLLPNFAGVLFGLFMLGVAGATLYYSFNGLKLIFPDDLAGVLFGMMLFDFAVFTWFMVFVSKCESTMQYVFSGIGFLIGLVGTLGLVGIEIGLSSGMLVQGTMAKPLTYIFVGVLIGHLLLIYAHHVSAPNISASISMGVEIAKVMEEGEKQADEEMKLRVSELGRVMAQRRLDDAYRQMNVRPNIPNVIDAKALPVFDDLNVQDNGYPMPEKAEANNSDSVLDILQRGARRVAAQVGLKPRAEKSTTTQAPPEEPVTGWDHASERNAGLGEYHEKEGVGLSPMAQMRADIPEGYVMLETPYNWGEVCKIGQQIQTVDDSGNRLIAIARADGQLDFVKYVEADWTTEVKPATAGDFRNPQ